ncbi:MAG: hypothetical protein Q8Q65_00875 [bacterium]|nr:hypothetical protein [bacterium]
MQLLRTQISLPSDIRKSIDAVRRLNKESLSSYIRKAVRLRLEMEKKEKNRTMEAVDLFISSGNKKSYSHWNTDKKIRNWQRELRAEN